MDENIPTALLVIRAWSEHGSAAPLRAQIRVTADVSSGYQHTLTLADPDQVLDAVRSFLEDVVCHSG
jgi:hypothetical protein